MIRLEPFTECDFETFKSWIYNAEELYQFAGSIFSYPVTDEQLQAYVEMKDKRPYKVVLEATNEAIGHCEMNFENGNNRLSRILVGNKNLRGQKIGEQLVRKLVDLFFQDETIKKVDLNTFSWNHGAIKCYEKVGFRINPSNTTEIAINGKVWIKINMVLNRR